MILRSLNNEELLRIWELAANQHPIDRALTVLIPAAGLVRSELAALSIGERNALLLELYRLHFGDALEGTAACPNCNTSLEFNLSLSSLREQAECSAAAEEEADLPPFRLPDSFDLAAISDCPDSGRAVRMLLERCIGEGAAVSSAISNDSDLVRIQKAMAARDPLAETLLLLDCPACGQQWQDLLQIEIFFWEALCAWVRSILWQVQALSREYHWSERDILQMSPLRRQYYLEALHS